MPDTNKDIVLEISEIYKSFGDLKVLKGISMQVERGEVVAVIGPSGGGKSTLLRCATTLEKVDSGRIVIGGDVLCDNGSYCGKKQEKEIRSKFGLVFQNFNLFPHFSVRRNITEALIHVHNKSREEADKICDALLKKNSRRKQMHILAIFRAVSSREYLSRELLRLIPRSYFSMSLHRHWILSSQRAF